MKKSFKSILLALACLSSVAYAGVPVNAPKEKAEFYEVLVEQAKDGYREISRDDISVAWVKKPMYIPLIKSVNVLFMTFNVDVDGGHTEDLTHYGMLTYNCANKTISSAGLNQGYISYGKFYTRTSAEYQNLGGLNFNKGSVTAYAQKHCPRR